MVRTTLIGGFVSGVAVYALSSYSPVFMQIVRGASATESGLWSIPNMAMVTFASITSGRLIARYGSYRPYPILGCVCMLLGAVLLATMDVHTSVAGVSARAALIGLGMGQLGPSMNLIVQNAVRYQDLGVATAGPHVRAFARRGARLGGPRRRLPQPARRPHPALRRRRHRDAPSGSTGSRVARPRSGRSPNRSGRRPCGPLPTPSPPPSRGPSRS